MHHPEPLRRALLKAMAVAAALPVTGMTADPDPKSHSLEAALAQLEQTAGGRLGVCVLDAHDGKSAGLRADERFGLCSTFKLLLAAVILREADAGRLALDEVLPYARKDLVPNSPVTKAQLASGGMPIEALAHATQTTSDNLAANLLMKRLGGPQALTAKLREMGDQTTRLDRWEPMMNRVPPGEVRDTSTPRALADTVARIFGEQLLAPASRAKLRDWTIATTTGTRRLRAGFPSDWIAGDKTGTGYAPGMGNKTNDIAIVWRADRAPLVVAGYYEAPGYFDRIRAEDEAVLAQVGKLVVGWV
ncbi:MAG: class A beta-lactamase [Rhodanobacteraceae bacterium]|nr:class A beta-lactamase [Rhodanobacteraceae bacterium]